MSLWQEFVCVFTEYGAVVITMPEVGKAYGAFQNVHAFMPVPVCRGISYPKR